MPLMGACKPAVEVPLEQALVVTAEAGPGLRKPGMHEYSDWTIHRGDVLERRSDHKDLSWVGKVDGESTTRQGPTLKVGRIPLDNSFWVFASDVRESSVAQEQFLCESMGNPTWFGAKCEQSIVRRRTAEGATAGFITCGEPTCPLVLAGKQGVFVTQIEGLSDVRVARIHRWDVLVVTSQWSREEGHTGHDAILMLANAGLRRIAVVPIVEADTRRPGRIHSQIATWSLTPMGFRVTGERAVVDRASGKRIQTTPIDDTWYITPGGVAKRYSAHQSNDR